MRITQPIGCSPLPLRRNGSPYRGINAPLSWGGAIQKGERSSLVVDTDGIIRTEANDKREEVAREIRHMKGHSALSVRETATKASGFHAGYRRPWSERL